MYHKSIVWKILAVLAVVSILAGCSQTPTLTVVPTATTAPTVDPKPTLDAVQTLAVATAMAGLTQNAPTVAPATPTQTQVPATATSAFTATPLPPTATATHAFIPWTKTPTAAPAEYACTVTGVSPASSTAIKVSTSFDGKWTVKNTGTQTWSAGNIDVRYIDGEKLQDGADLVDLPGDVAPNGTTTIIVDMKTPANDGTHKTHWGIYLPNNVICDLNLTVNVTNQ